MYGKGEKDEWYDKGEGKGEDIKGKSAGSVGRVHEKTKYDIK